MNSSEFIDMTPSELQAYIDSHKEKDYLLVDVRQPEEYETGHIPGARLIPVIKLVSTIYDLPGDKDLIFYCQHGSRSTAAAILVLEEKISQRQIYTLDGGIIAWNGKQLTNYPRVHFFDQATSGSKLLLSAIDLEKGAMRFYEHIARRFSTHDFSAVFAKLSTVEITHAKAVYNIWKSTERNPPLFEILFEQMDGNVIEGGNQLPEILKRVMGMTENICMGLVELALDIEYRAFELYKTMADRTTDSDAQSAFLSIAQAEKSHMKALIEATAICT